MQVTINPEFEQIIQAYLDSGRYQNPTEVLLAGLELLQRQEAAPNMSFGIIDQQNQFLPLTESEMAQESLKVLENYQQNGTSQSEIEAWANNLDGNRK
jgi:Bacterial antitoxin of ParD toxin-antitoxin type II system and RHH